MRRIQAFDVNGLQFLAYDRDQAQMMHDSLTPRERQYWQRSISPKVKAAVATAEPVADVYARRAAVFNGPRPEQAAAVSTAPDGTSASLGDPRDIYEFRALLFEPHRARGGRG